MSKDHEQPQKSEIDNDVSANSKGKARDTSDEESESMFSRLHASSRLALNALSTRSDLSGQPPTGKASPSGISNSGNTSRSMIQASSHKLRSTAQSESLRPHINMNSGPPAQAFDDFVRDDSTLGTEDVSRYGQLRDQNYDLSTPPSAVTKHERSDGAAVVDLLNGPSGELDAVLLGAEDPNTEYKGLTSEAANKLREALFPTNSVPHGSNWNDLLNFNPNYLSQSGPEAESERQLHLGTADTGEARSNWLQQWGNVLNGYTDHVWGDLEPLIAEARKEVEDFGVKGPEAAPDTKALNRLRQVLAHVRGF
ncbi:hypothetical protein FHETE_7268 [Fusarium heterosporum]|uniref:Uncharacterized protein n=1 Tax=Fusarium heterosporum TaxID=42747 RepID=A0A8H5WL77_FUSHE|nr:hypothetical protein FHETE_7268 [Fusarium heterosporum]